MGSVNRPSAGLKTQEGGAAVKVSPINTLRRAVLCCMLWEDTYYKTATEIVKMIRENAMKVSAEDLRVVMFDAKFNSKLRHTPLFLVCIQAERRELKAATVAQFCTRPDDMTELLSLWWKDGKRPIPSQMRKGLALAFKKFDAYQLQKYNRDKAVKLRDVLMLVRPKPDNEEQSKLWKSLLEKTLAPANTWETKLSGGADAKQTFETLITEKKLGSLAFLRNLRNIVQADVPAAVIRKGFETLNFQKILPFQFIAAARHNPNLEPLIEKRMLEALRGMFDIAGDNVLLVDVSGSMDSKLSDKSELRRLDAACGLAILLRAACVNIRVFTFSDGIVEVPARGGFALRDAICASQPMGGTRLGLAVKYVNDNVKPDRLFVLTDEQSADAVPSPLGTGYMINVASEACSVGFGRWNRVFGWSENVVSFIVELERQALQGEAT